MQHLEMEILSDNLELNNSMPFPGEVYKIRVAIQIMPRGSYD